MEKYGTREEVLKRLREWTSERRTICEVFREIYDLAESLKDKDLKEKFIDLICEGFAMGKKMNAKLVEYKEDWAKGVLEENRNWQEKQDYRLNRKYIDQLQGFHG